MDRGLIDSFEIKFKSASRNLKFAILVCSLLLAPCTAVEAQQLAKMPRIGFLNALFPTTNPARIEAFRQGLRDIGYVEGKNIVIEYRYAERKFDRLPALAAALVRLRGSPRYRVFTAHRRADASSRTVSPQQHR